MVTSSKTAKFVTATLDVDTLAFIVEELELSARLYENYADGADFLGDKEAKEKAADRAEKCSSIARAIALAGKKDKR